MIIMGKGAHSGGGGGGGGGGGHHGGGYGGHHHHHHGGGGYQLTTAQRAELGGEVSCDETRCDLCCQMFRLSRTPTRELYGHNRGAVAADCACLFAFMLVGMLGIPMVSKSLPLQITVVVWNFLILALFVWQASLSQSISLKKLQQRAFEARVYGVALDGSRTSGVRNKCARARARAHACVRSEGFIILASSPKH